MLPGANRKNQRAPAAASSRSRHVRPSQKGLACAYDLVRAFASGLVHRGAGVARGRYCLGGRTGRSALVKAEGLEADVGRAVSDLGVDLGSSQTVAAWASGRGVFAAVAGVNGRFGRPQRLSGIGVGDDSAQILAGDARGDALVLWQRSHPHVLGHGLAEPLFAAYRRAGGRFAPARRIAGNPPQRVGRAGRPRERRDRLGSVDRPTQAGGGRCRRSRRRRAVRPRQRRRQRGVSLRGLAVDPAGQAVVVWDSGAFPATGMQAATRRPSGQFTAPVSIVPSTVGASSAGGVGIDHAGRVLIAWDGRYDGASSGLGHPHVHVTPLAVGAMAPGATQTLATPDAGAS